MTTRGRNALRLLVAAAAVAALLRFVWGARRQVETRPRALDAVPSGALLVATVDLVDLRASPLGARLLRDSREIPGLGPIRDVCGFDPMDSLREIALAIPAAADAGELGVVGVGDVDDDALLACIRRVIEGRGGRLIVTKVGGFRTMRDAEAAELGGEIAVRRGGPVLLGAGAYLRSMIDTAEGRWPTVRASSAHDDLARAVGGGSVTVTVVPSPEQREALAAELAAAASASPATRVVAAALGVRLGPVVSLHGVVACEGSDSCADLAVALREARDDRVRDPATRLIGIADVLSRVQLEPRGGLLHVRVDVGAEDAAVLVDRIMTLRGIRHPMPDDRRAPDRGEPPPVGEVVHPRPSAAVAASASAPAPSAGSAPVRP